jgi:N-acetylneuraminic acid mutarotase
VRARKALWVLGVVAVALLSLTAAKAQFQGPGTGETPKGRWSKAAGFPEPEEELYGINVNGKMYVLGGFGLNPFGKPPGLVYEYDPTTDKWTKKKNMPLPVHHQAMATVNGKIYMFGGYLYYPVPGGGQGWQPVDNSWVYDPATNDWKALAPMPDKRGTAIAEQVNGKIYVIGGATMNPGSKEPAVFPNRPARSVGTNDMYDPATDKWESRSPMPTARNHAFSGMVDGKIYVIGGRIGSPFITVAQNIAVVEEYDPATDQWGAPRRPMPTPRSGGGWGTHGGRIYIAGGEQQTREATPAFRALEAYEPATDTWTILPSMPVPRHGVAGAFIGNQLHLVSGKVTSSGAPDTKLETSTHDVFEVLD